MESTLKQTTDSIIRVAIVGPESTGKTTLATQLAAHYNTVMAPEYMREYFSEVAPRTPFRSYYKDIMPIAQGQILAENNAATKANKLLFCDTNLLEIACYSEYYFERCPREILQASRQHEYALTFLTGIDVPWQKDELRDRPFDRQKLFSIFELALTQQSIPNSLLQGSQEERLAKAKKTIDNYCKLHGI